VKIEMGVGMNNKILPVIKREFLTRVKTKGFIIGTAIFPILMFLLLLVPILLSTLKSEKQQHFTVIDLTGRVYVPLVKNLADTTKKGLPVFLLKLLDVASPEQLIEAKVALSAEINDKKIEGYLFIPKTVLENNVSEPTKDVEFYARNVTNFQMNRNLENALTSAIRTLRLQDSGLDPVTINRLIRGINLKTFKVSAGGEQEDRGFTFGLTYFLVMILYMMLIIYGAMITRSVVEEKNTRVVELVVAAVKPFQLMTGKIFGVGAVGLLQFLIWSVTILVLSLYRLQIGQMFGASMADLTGLPSLSLAVVAFFILFFLLGFLFFATMFAAVGAMVNSDQEAQQVQMPLIMFLVVPMMIMIYIIGNPDSTAAIILSMIPFFSPIIMFMRISVLMPPAWEIGLAVLILILSIIGMIWLTGKIYRVGILMYGKRPTLPELVKWIRYS